MINCMYALPHELTGTSTTCGLFGGKLACNGYGNGCVGYRSHTAESRKVLADAIAEKRKKQAKKGADA